MDGIAEFLDMGGHAAFVWPAFGLSAAVLIALVGRTLFVLRRRERLLKSLEKAQGGRPS